MPVPTPEALFLSHYPMLLSVASRILPLAADAEDAVSNAFMLMITHWDSHIPGHESQWAHTVVKRAALEIRRRRGAEMRKGEILFGSLPEYQHPKVPSYELAYRAKELLAIGLRGLDLTARDALDRWAQGKLDDKNNAAKIRTTRARAKVRAAVVGAGG